MALPAKPEGARAPPDLPVTRPGAAWARGRPRGPARAVHQITDPNEKARHNGRAFP